MNIPEEDKWLMINQCETLNELVTAILLISDEEGYIESNRQDKKFEAAKQVRNAHQVIEVGLFPNILTRAYGIRQQAIYIRYYQQKEKIHGNDYGGQHRISDNTASNDLESRSGPVAGPCLDGIQAPPFDTNGRAN